MTEQQGQVADFDYSFVETIARIALYDDMKSAPRITKIGPAPTNEFIEKLASTVHEQVKLVGGTIPYTVIREVSENFIHAQFREIVVSIFDNGETVRFADQGPGIQEKEKAKEPGFSSAIEPMKGYIRGVGSGLPIVNDYLSDRDGSIYIEDNLVNGAVVTVSLVKKKPIKPSQQSASSERIPLPFPPLTQREIDFIMLLQREGELGISEISNLTDTPMSTTHYTLSKLGEAGLVETSTGKKRSLTELGYQIAAAL